ETPEDVAERLRRCLAFIPPEKLSAIPDCGFFPVPRWLAAEKLKRLVAGPELGRRGGARPAEARACPGAARGKRTAAGEAPPGTTRSATVAGGRSVTTLR